MTIWQLFFALAGVMVALGGFFKYYLDAKVDPIAKNIDLLVHYMVEHEGRIARLEERTK